LCDTFTQREWSDAADTCNQVCVAAATGELSDCTADADASIEEKSAFWGCCSFGQGLAKGSGCAQDCAWAESVFEAVPLEPVCRAICKESFELTPRSDQVVSCREGVCSGLSLCGGPLVEACFRGCSLASGVAAKLDHPCEDCY
jgi:hypothetical protein